MLFLMRIPGWLYCWLVSIMLFGGMLYVGIMADFKSGYLVAAMVAVAHFGAIFGMLGLVAYFARKWDNLGLRYAKYAKEDGYVNHAEKAARYFLKSALFRGDAALINLGLCYAEGFGLEKDLVKAARCYKIAAKDSSVARLALGLCYAEGIGVEKDMVKAENLYKKAGRYFGVDEYWNPIGVIMWMRKAAEWGSVPVQCELAHYYECGRYVAKDEAEAVKWYRKAAEQEYAQAQCSLGMMYIYGKGVEKDEAEAIRWFKKAAKQGEAGAQYYLGDCYSFGLGVAKDESEAIAWYRKAEEKEYGCWVAKQRKAAEDGEVASQYGLGLDYETGNCVIKNEEEAVKWYRKAAEQGNADAQYKLGRFYERGWGVVKNGAEAMKWYRKAAEQGHQYAIEQIEELTNKSSPEA